MRKPQVSEGVRDVGTAFGTLFGGAGVALAITGAIAAALVCGGEGTVVTQVDATGVPVDNPGKPIETSGGKFTTDENGMPVCPPNMHSLVVEPGQTPWGVSGGHPEDIVPLTEWVDGRFVLADEFTTAEVIHPGQVLCVGSTVEP